MHCMCAREIRSPPRAARMQGLPTRFVVQVDPISYFFAVHFHIISGTGLWTWAVICAFAFAQFAFVHLHLCICISAFAFVHLHFCICIPAFAFVHRHLCISICALAFVHWHLCIGMGIRALDIDQCWFIPLFFLLFFYMFIGVFQECTRVTTVPRCVSPPKKVTPTRFQTRPRSPVQRDFTKMQRTRLTAWNALKASSWTTLGLRFVGCCVWRFFFIFLFPLLIT